MKNVTIDFNEEVVINDSIFTAKGYFSFWGDPEEGIIEGTPSLNVTVTQGSKIITGDLWFDVTDVIWSKFFNKELK